MFLLTLFCLSNNFQAYWKYEVATVYCMLRIYRGHAPRCLFRALQDPFPAEVFIVPRSSVIFRADSFLKTKAFERVYDNKLSYGNAAEFPQWGALRKMQDCVYIRKEIMLLVN